MSTTENVKLGVCSVIYDGENMGFTKGGVNVTVETTAYEMKVDQLGETPIGERITGRTVSAEVPLAETILENLVRIMPGATLVSNGVQATGTITLATAAPVDGDRIQIGNFQFTFRANPTMTGDVKIGAGAGAAGAAASAANLAAAINASEAGYVATVAGAVVTVKSRQTGTKWNVTVSATFATPANATVTNLTGGTNATSASVVVTTGTSIDLTKLGKILVLRPKNTFGEDDFTIFSAACPGALSFSYSNDNERVFNANFKGYAQADGRLFKVGN